MAGRTKEAEKMTLDIIHRQDSCIECYRLLSAIYSKLGNYSKVCMDVYVCLLVKGKIIQSMIHSQQEIVLIVLWKLH